MKNNRSNKRWTREDNDFVRENFGKLSLEDMAKQLKRSSMSVRLYILRKRMTIGTRIKRNLLLEMLKIKFRYPEDFNPTRIFFKETGIGQRRYWDLYFGRKAITGKEYAAIAEYFGITIEEALESRQLELFEENQK